MRTFRTSVMATVMMLAPLVALPASAQSDPSATSQAQQQPSGGGGIGVGVLGGVTMAHLTDTSVLDTKFKTAPMAGIWFGGNRAGVLGFMGEISYVVKSVEDRGSEEQLKLHYLEIPAMFRVNIGAPGKNAPCLYFIGGPVVDILLKGELEGVDVKDQFNGYDFGILGGVGFEVMRIGAELRGNWGLKSLVNNEGSFEMTDTKSFTIQIVGKIRFN